MLRGLVLLILFSTIFHPVHGDAAGSANRKSKTRGQMKFQSFDSPCELALRNKRFQTLPDARVLLQDVLEEMAVAGTGRGPDQVVYLSLREPRTIDMARLVELGQILQSRYGDGGAQQVREIMARVRVTIRGENKIKLPPPPTLSLREQPTTDMGFWDYNQILDALVEYQRRMSERSVVQPSSFDDDDLL